MTTDTNSLLPRLRRASCASASFTVLALSACGGGGGDAEAEAAPSTAPVTASSFVGNAYLKTTNTVLFDGKTYGLAREAVQAQVDQCNGVRQLYYKLGAVSPAEAAMAAADTFVHEKYFAIDKALTVITGTVLTLPDMQRWLKQLSSVGASGYPAVPPDCSQVTANPHRNGTLWRDGLVYQLRYDAKKASGLKASTVPTRYVSSDRFMNFAAGSEAGQTCREVVGVTDLAPTSHACVWDLFPYAAYLNWPFALSGRVQFGPDAQQFETIVAVTAQRGVAFQPSIFEIPAGFTVTVN
jgi:hypothetical protein